MREGQHLSTLQLIWSVGLGVEDGLHFFSTPSTFSMQSQRRGVDESWDGLVDGLGWVAAQG